MKEEGGNYSQLTVSMRYLSTRISAYGSIELRTMIFGRFFRLLEALDWDRIAHYGRWCQIDGGMR